MLCASLSGSSLVVSPAGTVCAAGDLVVLTSAEANQLFNSPFALDPVQGAEVAIAVLSVWAVGWGFRMLIRTLNSADGSEYQD